MISPLYPRPASLFTRGTGTALNREIMAENSRIGYIYLTKPQGLNDGGCHDS